MSLIITHNVSALNTQRTLNQTSKALAKSLEKLSSGYKINVAADDPSGLIISEQLRSQANGLQRAIRNSQEASNVIGITEGALIEMNEILRKLRALALHAANNGITAPDQVRADQAEMDSSIQTIDRIANTTRYSDQFLLNGSKGLVYDRRTIVDDARDHALLDVDRTRIDQVFKRTGAALTISFSGEKTATQADYTQEARRAYFEANPQVGGTQISTSAPNAGKITADQSFILTGTAGSRQFRFAAGTDLGAIVSSINNVKDSLGVGATLIFDSSVTGSGVSVNYATGRAAGMVCAYNLDANFDQAADNAGINLTANGSITANNYNALVTGYNLDGDGRMWIKWTSATTYIAYKDRAMSMEVGRGTSGVQMTESNYSEVSTAQITITAGAGTTANSISMIQFGYQFEMNDVGLDESGMATLSNFANDATSALSGVRLGVNTDENGLLYYRVTRAGAGLDKIEIFRNSNMELRDLVAQATGLTLGAGSFRVFAEELDAGEGELSGLYATMTFSGAPANGVYTGTLKFDCLGMRLYSLNYGSSEYVRVQNISGQLWGTYQNPDSTTLNLLEEGQTKQVLGEDATITVNGLPLKTQGLTANITTPDYSGALVFSPGELGLTTIAQAGYDVGALNSRATALQAIDEGTPTNGDLTFATNARHATAEVLENFIGGMQLQLGGGEGDQERTVYGIQSMAAANIGKCLIDGQIYTLQDVLAGGSASLLVDPIKALRIITQAVNDVSELRARLGAFQKNMLQTNINSLEVTVENITRTESAIRDANMAEETTEFTKNQILLQAGTAMLAQANTASQNILQLLG